MISPAKRPWVQTNGDRRFKSISVHKIPLNTISPVKDLLQMAESNRDRLVHPPNPLDFEKGPSNRHIKVTNSTAMDGEYGHGEIALELSSIAADHSSPFFRTWKGQKIISNLIQPKSMESPAKIFARLKAKALSENKLQQKRDDTANGQVHQGQNKTPRKSEQPWINTEVKEYEEFHQATYDVEALTLSPLPTPVKGPTFQSNQTLGLDMQKEFKVTPKSTCPALKPVNGCTPVKWHGSLYSCTPAPSVHPLDDDLSTNVNTKDVPFAVPKPPVKKAPLLPALRPEPSQNSPAKIFTLMKEKVELQKRQQEANQVGSMADASHGEAALESSTRSLRITSANESDCEVSQDMFAVSLATPTAGSSLSSDEPIVQTFEPVPTGPIHGPPPDITDDALLQNSPRIRIPKKRVAMFQQRAGQDLIKPKKRQDSTANEIHLKEWHVKMVNSGFFVDGVRVDDNMPWHSNIIAERISSNKLKTISGSIYVLLGRMVPSVDKSLPGWLQKKFLFGFPEKWKVYLQDYLEELKSRRSDSDKNKQKGKGSHSRPAQKQSRSTTESRTPGPSSTKTHRTSPPSGILGSDTKVSRSGRLLKPPLEFWKGARVIVDSDMNVTIQDSYMSTPTPLVQKWKKAMFSTSSKSVERAPSKGVHGQRLAERGRARAESNPDPGSSKSSGISHKQQPSRDARKEGLAETAGQLSVQLLPLLNMAQLQECCQNNNLHFSPAESDPEPGGRPGVHSTSLSDTCFTDERQGRSQPEDDEPSAPQRRVKQRLRAKNRPRKEAPLPGSRAEKQTTDLQPATRSKLSRDRVELQKALLGSDTDCTPGPTIRTGRRVRKCRFKNATSALQTGSSSSEAEALASRPEQQPQARKPARGGLATVRAGRPDSGDNLSNETQRVLRASSRDRQSMMRTTIPALQGHPGQRCMLESEARSGSAVRWSSRQRMRNSTNSDMSEEGQGHRVRSRGRGGSDSGRGAEPPHDQDLTESPEISALLKRSDTNLKGLERQSSAIVKDGEGKRSAVTGTGNDEGESRAKTLRGKSRATIADSPLQTSNGVQGVRQKSKAAVSDNVGARPVAGGRAQRAATADPESELDDFQPSPDNRGCKNVGCSKRKDGQIHQQVAESLGRNRVVRKGMDKRNNKNAKAARERKGEEEEDDAWTEKEVDKLQKAVSCLPKHQSGFWVNVAMMVGTRSATECQEQYTCQQSLKVWSRRKKAGPSKEEPAKEPLQITAKVGTLKRKKQMRNFLDNMPKDNHDDMFSSSPLQSKRVKLPALSTNTEDHVFQQLQQNPQTPSSSGFPLVKTPQCLHISPGMLGSINRNNNDNYVYKLQKKMGREWAGLRGPGSPFQDKYTITPSTKPKRGTSDAKKQSFPVWEMFSGKDSAPLPSDESGEEDYYFMEDD